MIEQRAGIKVLALCIDKMEPTQTVKIRFPKDLTLFLKHAKNRRTFTAAVKGHPSIKDTIEALGIPHTEVAYLLVNNRSVDFNYQIKGGESIRVLTDRNKARSKPVIKLQKSFPYRPRFILDVHLGKLARHLRLLGFDTLYQRDYTDRQIVDHIKREKRIVLTRDIGLLKNKAIQYGYFVRAIISQERVKEVVRRFQLSKKIKPFTLCLNCNGKIRKAAKEKIAHKLPPETKKFYTTFYECRSCGKVYWKGAHHRRLSTIIAKAS